MVAAKVRRSAFAGRKKRIEDAASLADIVFGSARRSKSVDLIKQINAAGRARTVKNHSQLLRRFPENCLRAGSHRPLRQRLMLSGKREWRSSQGARPRGSKQSAGASSPLSPARSQRNHLGMCLALERDTAAPTHLPQYGRCEWHRLPLLLDAIPFRSEFGRT